ncbi:hypothetical protein [Pseudomonas frederiksbergensis]|uniref:hypothetical protein n=1 Tax=Pseudomonas frederiksbergensis TaxID=104087 RepID=UPI003D229D65
MPTENKTPEPSFDLNTPDGGRGYIAHLFKTALKRHDYRQYIAERLAGDFACTLAQHLERITAERDALQLRLNAADQRIDGLTQDRDGLIAYGRSEGLNEASTLCSRMAYDTYYPASSRFKYFVPRAQARLGDLLIKAANAIASLPGGPYDRFKASQLKKAEKSAVA